MNDIEASALVFVLTLNETVAKLRRIAEAVIALVESTKKTGKMASPRVSQPLIFLELPSKKSLRTEL